MSPLTILVIFLVFNLIGRLITPPKRQRHYHDIDMDYRRPILPHNTEDELDRRAWTYTLVFVALLATAMYLAHDLLHSEVTFVLK